MGIISKCYKQYETQLSEKQIKITVLDKGEDDYQRLLSIILEVNSHYLLPRDENIKLESYVKKLIEKAYNFIFSYKGQDIAVLSFYANDYSTKIAFANIIGILGNYRGTELARKIVDFCIDFCKEKGMEYLRTHINKTNLKSVGLVRKFHFEIEGEKDEDTWVFIKDLRS